MKVNTMSKTIVVLGVALFIVALPLINAEVAAKPEPEGTLTVLVPTLAEEGFLPDRCSGSTGPLWEAVYDYLLYSKHENPKPVKPIPGLAERYEYSNDYKTLTFYLRKGIKWRDGWGEVTAEDVKFSIEFNMSSKSRNLRKSNLTKGIKSVETPDKYTVVLNLKSSAPMFWLLFCTADSVALPVLCKKYIETVGEEKANRSPIGSGPYRLVEQKVGDYAKFEAYSDHWLVVPEYKYMVLKVVPEETTRMAMIKTGEADIAMEMTLNRVPESEKIGLKPIVSPDANVLFITFGGMFLPEDKRYVEGKHRKDPWADQRVREAMILAIDRNAINESIYFGKATVAPLFWTLPGWEDLKPPPYDPQKAKQLLTEAGYPNGFDVKMYTHRKKPELPVLTEAVAGYWQAVGIKAQIHQTDYATFRKQLKKGKTDGVCWIRPMSDYPDWTSRLRSYLLPNASSPLWQSEETNALIKKVRKESDIDKRTERYKELTKKFYEITAIGPFFFTPKVHVANPKKVGEWFPGRILHPKNVIFARHPVPLNTQRLFTP